MRVSLATLLLAVLLPAAAAGQGSDITRRSFTFFDDRLVVNVLGHAPGELQLVRGEPGRVEVAARSDHGFPGFGLGGTLTRELRLTSVGAEQVRFLVVVPENVRVTVQLPDGASASLPSRAPTASYQWGTDTLEPTTLPEVPLVPTLANGMYLVHATTWAPSSVDIPDLFAVRSLSLRFEGAEFRIAASRPLSVEAGSAANLELRLGADPVDIIIYVPRGNGTFRLRSGGTRLAELISGRARALCGNVVIQRPTVHQDWLTFHPQQGSVDCRADSRRR